MRRVRSVPVSTGNSMAQWWKIANPLRSAWHVVLFSLLKYCPFLGLKNWLYRTTGMKVGKGVSIGLGAMFDIFFPQLISIGDRSVIGYNVTVLTHEFLVKEWRVGKVEIGKEVLLGANTVVLPGVRIGDGAVVGACSLVAGDVKPGSRVGGVPARPLSSS